MNYTSLHNHTCYSTLDAISNPEKLAQAAKNMGMQALAITDHGTMGGIPEFAIACKKAGIKAIFGLEAYYVPHGMENHTPFKTPLGKEPRAGYHLTLLAKNYQGYLNLVRLNNEANLRGFYWKPKIDWETLVKYKEGLIVLSGCPGSELNSHALAGQLDKVEEIAKRFLEAFGQDFFIEVMNNYMEEDVQRKISEAVIPIAAKLGIKVVPTNDSHYINAESREYHNMMFQVNKTQEIKKKAYSGKKGQKGYDGIYHLKTFDEMYKLFGPFVQNTELVAERVEDFDLFTKNMKLPNQITNVHNILTMMARGGLTRKGLSHKPEYVARLNRELNIIEKMGFPSYFITTREIIDIIRDSNCPLGWGRGSGGGSLVCYCLEITDVDPIKFGLIIERFISEYRPDWPDIDLDIPQERRDEILRKIIDKFGSERVAHISTANSFRPKMLIRDICREMKISSKDADKYSRLVPFGAQDYEAVKETDLEEELNKSQQGRFILKAFQELAGVHRHLGIHASGVVISSEDLPNLIPIRQEEFKWGGQKQDRYVTQYTMNYLDKVGLLKFDLLGLKTLDMIYSIADEVGVNPKEISFEDPKPFELIGNGQVAGMFQLDKAKTCAELCKTIKPQNIMDVSVILALHRPGVMGSDQYGAYLRRRAGKEAPQYFHPGLQDVLESTLGVCIFQEDLMKMSEIYVEYTMAEVENLRKGIGKKDMSIIKNHMQIIAERAQKLGRSYVAQVIQQVEAAGRYSFNKSHAVAYAHVTYMCAYLSAYHPLQFFKHLISLSADEDERAVYLSEAMGRGISILPPDINISDRQISIEGNSLRLGLRSVKGVGDITAKEIIENRPLKDVKQVKLVANKSVYTALYAAGALNGIPQIAQHPPAELLEDSDVLGISLSGLMDRNKDVVQMVKAVSTREVGADPLTVIIKIAEIRKTTDKKQRAMAFLKVLDVFGPRVNDAVMFWQAYKDYTPEKNVTYSAVVSRSHTGSLMLRQLVKVEDVRRAHSAQAAPGV